ncbi:phage tail assembly protein [Glaesserella parasuis]|nr:phage tail assembly protein [Glaesserella parasuis]
MSKSNEAVTTLKNLRVYTTHKLKYPITKPDGEVLNEINLRRIKGSDLEAFENKNFNPETDDYKMVRFYLNRLSNWVYEDIDELDAADFNALSTLIIELVTEGKPKKPVN